MTEWLLYCLKICVLFSEYIANKLISVYMSSQIKLALALCRCVSSLTDPVSDRIEQYLLVCLVDIPHIVNYGERVTIGVGIPQWTCGHGDRVTWHNHSVTFICAIYQFFSAGYLSDNCCLHTHTPRWGKSRLVRRRGGGTMRKPQFHRSWLLGATWNCNSNENTPVNWPREQLTDS